MRGIRCSLQHQITKRNGNKNGANVRERPKEKLKGERKKKANALECARGNVSTFYHALPIASQNSRISTPSLDQTQQSAEPNQREKKSFTTLLAGY